MTYRICNEDLLEVLNAPSGEDLVTRTSRVCQRLGFEYFVYGSQRDDTPIVFSAYPMGWQRKYAQERLIEVDPTVRHAMQSCLPLVWTPELFEPPDSARMYEEARAHGVRSGLSLSMHGCANQRAMVSFASDMPMCEARDRHAHDVLAEALLVMSYVHEAAQRLVKDQPAPPPDPGSAALTPRELECLRWSMAGKSSWETGQIIACTERTVNFHIGNAIRKLEVPNRRSAVVKALALHLISA